MSDLFFRRLDTVGDGSGTTNMNVDGGTTPVVFKIAPGATQRIVINRMMLFCEDTGTFDSGNWGNGIEMTTGFNFKDKDNGVTTDLLGFGVKTTGDMTSICHDINHLAIGAGNEFVSWRWTFTKAGKPLFLLGELGDEFSITINDNLEGLVKFYAMVQGYYK